MGFKINSDSKRASFEQYLEQNNIDSEAFEEARQLLIDNIKIPDYFKVIVDSRVDLDFRPLTCCILHDETTPSFRYYNNTEKYHCFGCGKTGTVVELHYYYTKRDNPRYTLIKSVRDLADMFNVKIPNLQKDSGKIFTEIARKKEIENIKDYKGKKLNLKRELPLKTIKLDVENRIKPLRKKDLDKYMEFTHKIDTAETLKYGLRDRYEEMLEELKNM